VNDCEAPTGTVWYARAEIADSAGNVFATSSIISFNVLFNPGATPAACTGDSIADSLCRIFYDPVKIQNAFGNFTQLWLLIKNKPPLGYFTLSANLFGSLSTTTIATSTQLQGVSSLSIFAELRNAVNILLIFLVLMWAFHRLRNLNL
jgi:hypothetical protein